MSEKKEKRFINGKKKKKTKNKQIITKGGPK